MIVLFRPQKQDKLGWLSALSAAAVSAVFALYMQTGLIGVCRLLIRLLVLNVCQDCACLLMLLQLQLSSCLLTWQACRDCCGAQAAALKCCANLNLRVCASFRTLQNLSINKHCLIALLAGLLLLRNAAKFRVSDMFLLRNAAKFRVLDSTKAHLYNSKLLLNELDKGQEVLPVQAILIQLCRRLVGGEQDEGAVLTQPREQLQNSKFP